MGNSSTRTGRLSGDTNMEALTEETLKKERPSFVEIPFGSAPSTPGAYRLHTGVEKQSSLLFLCRSKPDRRVVVAFPGDVSVHAAEMSASGSPWVAFSWEGIVEILGRRFVDDDILLVKPESMVHIRQPCGSVDFAIFSNLVDDLGYLGDAEGGFCCTGLASQRLTEVLAGAGIVMSQRLVLVNFSKGGVVMGHLLAELQQQPVASDLLARCDALHLLDFGTSKQMGKGAYLDPACFPGSFEKLALLMREARLKVFLHNTPYLDSVGRPWVKKEVQAFVHELQQRGATPVAFAYYEGETCTLAHHFELLRIFRTSVSDDTAPITG